MNKELAHALATYFEQLNNVVTELSESYYLNGSSNKAVRALQSRGEAVIAAIHESVKIVAAPATPPPAAPAPAVAAPATPPPAAPAPAVAAPATPPPAAPAPAVVKSMNVKHMGIENLANMECANCGVVGKIGAVTSDGRLVGTECGECKAFTALQEIR